jgi:ubiquitin carboxyl-terminal hydrolase 5/13
MEVVKSNLSRIRVPGTADKVFKDECLYSFDSPECPTGLYVCLNRFLGVGEKYLDKYSKRTDNFVFLHIKRIRKEVEDTGVPEKVSKLAINVDGGFNTDDKTEWVETSHIVVLPSRETIELNNPDLPMQVSLAAAGILTSVSATRQAQVDAASGTWDGEVLAVSKHADSVTQIENPPPIAPSGWKCEECDLKENLWLNLTDGRILCGRRNFDGSGGNNHGVDHYKAGNTGGPLAVKLGTITRDGKGDVFSYDEDDMVLNPNLEKHLAHFGIKMAECTKTDKSMIELQIEMNEKIGEWAILTESGSKLEPLYGPKHTGLHNLGNTCYMNSVLQVLFSLPEFISCYECPAYMDRCDLADPDSDLKLQLAKLCHGLASGEYSLGPDKVKEAVLRDEGSQPGVKPVMLKNLLGRGHHEFSSTRQQDAQEFYLHLLTLIERAHRNNDNLPPSNLFKFSVEDRTECAGQVRYKTRNEMFLPFNIPLEAASNFLEVEEFKKHKAEVEAKGEMIPKEEEVRYKISFPSVVENFLGQSIIDDVFSQVLGAKTQAKQSARLKTFPNYLLISLSKYQVDSSWQPVKLNVEVDMPTELDLSALLGAGPQSGEVLMTDDAEPAKAEETVYENEETVSQLMEMGFSREGCKRAVHNTKNSGLEAAMTWVMEHMGDPDFNEPFNLKGSGKKEIEISEENIAMVMSMGFEADLARTALKNTDNNVERAIEWIFSHPEGASEPAASSGGGAGASSSSTPDPTLGLTNGEPRYNLLAFVSHMGNSPQSGHYVCHIKEGDRWIIFNDNKVATSERPPKELGYLYLYKRCDV